MLKINYQKLTMNEKLPKQSIKILVVDDYSLILAGTIQLLRKQYPEAELFTAKTVQEVINQVSSCLFDLVIIDLSIPENEGIVAATETGLQLVGRLMEKYHNLNIMILTGHPQVLAQIRHEIDNHQGGFTVADKQLNDEEILIRVKLALDGITHTKDLGTKIEFKPEWLELLRLAFKEGLTDKAIADRMHCSQRNVRNYFTKIQDVLGIYPEYDRQDGNNIRVMTGIQARRNGLID